ncbi:MAG TPA: LppX_LprAFG lipoprotein [Gaiellaceae bacterium]|nr:LppX_LprAFG lipoprotein [Gaiellaceae bacterium]
MRRPAMLAAFALLAAGCGGGGGSASPADIAQAAQKTSSTGSFEADFGISGQGLSGTGSGVFDNGDSPAGQLTMTVKAAGQQIPVDTVVTGDIFYMRSPAFARTIGRGKQWIKLDLAKLAKQRGVDLGGLLNASPTPNNALAYLGGADQVKKVGGEQVGGQDTTHYRVRVDVSKAAHQAKGSARSSLEGVRASGLAKLPIDVWVDANGYIRKVSYQEHAGRRQAAKVTMKLHDFGRRVSIAPPPSASVFDLTRLQR